MDVELKPCPFCGGESKFTEVGSDLSNSRKLTIQCKGCRFKLTNAAMRYGFDWLYEITITAWNTRHGDADRSAELTTAWMAGVERERESAAEDSARLDWVIEQHATLFTDGAGQWHVAYEYTNPATHGPMADSPRAAIDAARAGERG